MRPWAKECPQLPEAARDKEGFSPLEFPGETSPANILILAPYSSVQTSGLQNFKRIHFCCWKPLNLWKLVTVAKETHTNSVTWQWFPTHPAGLSPGVALPFLEDASPHPLPALLPIPSLRFSLRDFPGGPVAKTPRSQCRGPGSIPG